MLDWSDCRQIDDFGEDNKGQFDRRSQFFFTAYFAELLSAKEGLIIPIS